MKVSVSSMKLFKACPRAYELKYIEGLEPIDKASALVTGASYHAKVEQINRDGDFEMDEDAKTNAMALAYKKYIAPKVNVTLVEEWKEKMLDDEEELLLVGRLDGFTDDGCVIEHKTTSSAITEEYEYNLQWDEQILAYMYMTGARKIYYTVCMKPSIRQKKNETDEEFFDRMVSWYDEDTDSKIRLLTLTRTDEEVKRFHHDAVLTAFRMKMMHKEPRAWRQRNMCHCNSWGRRCEYSSVCFYYDKDQDYVEYVKIERRDKDGN